MQATRSTSQKNLPHAVWQSVFAIGGAGFCGCKRRGGINPPAMLARPAAPAQLKSSRAS